MASPLAFSAFLLRDVFKYLLPTLIALILFVPPFYPSIELTKLVFPSIVLGYVLTPIAGKLFLRMPGLTSDLAELEGEITRGAEAWDYTAVYYAMTKDERDSILQADAYETFHLMIAGYFFVFGVANMGFVAQSAISDCMTWGRLELEPAISLQTPLIDDLQAPSWLLGVVATLLSRQASRDYLALAKTLHIHEYDAYARKYQREGQSVARGIWGTVVQATRPYARQRAEIVGADGTTVSSTRTDDEGRFLFKDCYRRLLGKRASIAFPDGGVSFPIEVTSNTVPEFSVLLDESFGTQRPFEA